MCILNNIIPVIQHYPLAMASDVNKFSATANFQVTINEVAHVISKSLDN
jgi:hypothetical protein